jgi:hypothetical protein
MPSGMASQVEIYGGNVEKVKFVCVFLVQS